MESRPQQGGNSPPPKPWERAGTSSGPPPFKPSSPGSTSDVVEASGTAKPGEIVLTAERNTPINRNAIARPVPTRPWESNYGNTSYGGYGSGVNNYSSGYGSNTYGSYGGVGGSYGGVGGVGGGMYGNSMYSRVGYGGVGGGMYGGSGMYGGGMYSGGLGGPMGGYGMGMGGPYGDEDPPPQPPSFWMSFLRVMGGVVTVFGRISFLVEQNTHAFHMFISALLQFFEKSGLLYGEIARFVLRLLGFKTKSRKVHPPGPDGLPGPQSHHPNGGGQRYIEGPKLAPPSGSWDNVWGN